MKKKVFETVAMLCGLLGFGGLLGAVEFGEVSEFVISLALLSFSALWFWADSRRKVADEL